MKRIRHSPEQIIRKLREADAELARGTAIPEACKALGIAENTSYRWRNRFGEHHFYRKAALFDRMLTFDVAVDSIAGARH